MTQKYTWVITGIATAILAIVIVIVALVAPTTNGAFQTSAATLAFITGAAVAIERAIEAGWTVVGGIKGSYWPLNVVGNQVNTLVTNLDTALQPYYQGATDAVETLSKAGQWSQEQITSATTEIEQFKQRFRDLKALAPDNQRIQLLVAAAAQNVAYIEQKYQAHIADFTRVRGIADEAINGLQNFVASFKDNPGRRLIGLYVGVVVGLVVAGLMGLDLIQATLQIPPEKLTHPRLDIVLTGAVLGLGSSPTHEVIRAIQEYKKNRKGDNVAKPDEPDRAGQ
jgi:hypothetical protein